MNEAWSIFAGVAAAHALAVASPGPDFAILIRQTLQHGRQIGILTAMGIGSGILFHVAWGMFGLAWLLEQMPSILNLLRYGGAALLLWFGIESLRGSSDKAADVSLAPASASKAYLLGLATNVLNAKAVLFFVALCSSVLATGASPALRIGLGIWLSLATMAWFSFLALTVGHPAIRQRLTRSALRINQVMGLILIAIAVALVWPDGPGALGLGS